MAKLKPWYHVVTPREDLREKRPLDASEFAVHLDHVRTGRAHADYTDPHRFFERTYMTGALRELCAQTVRRLSGNKVETSAVFNMATQFGGGKTHALTALYHLARGGEAAKAWKGVDVILHDAGVSTIPEARVAVFVGTEFDVLEGRGGNGEPVRKTPWGDIAWQLGGEKAYRVIEEHDQKTVAPGGDVLRQMLPDEPTLILMDELLNYVSRGRKLGLRDAMFNFIQNLCEEARARDNLVVCVSIPKSELEMNPDDQRDHESLKKLLDRLGRAIMMAAERETSEIIRRRLFEWEGLPEDGKKAALQYADWAIDNAASLTGIDASNARELFLASYPFHPAVLSVFERKWQSLPRFQRTRGILRLLALWVAHNYQEEHRTRGGAGDQLIMLGSAPVEDPTFRAALFEQLGNNDLEGPVTTDIAGKSDAWAEKLDREASNSIRKHRLHKKAATVILFESNGGQTRDRASLPEIRTAVAGPDVLLAEVEQVLESLVRSCYYLTQEGNYYRFSLSPNLNKMLTDYRAGVSERDRDDRLRREIEKVFRAGPRPPERCFWPDRTQDVPDRAELTLVVLGPEYPATEPATKRWMEQITREHGSSGRTMKSALLFVAPEDPTRMNEAAKSLIAWEQIDEDEDAKKRLDETQVRQLDRAIKRAERDLREVIWRAYRRVYLLDTSGDLKEIDLGQITSSAADSLVEYIVNRLVRDDEITEGVGANRLLKYWPPALTQWSTKAVRDAFYSSPALPRLLNPDAIKRTIADGVAQGLIGYARDMGSAGLRLERRPGDSMAESDVEIADDVFILKREDALKLVDPPKLTEIRVEPAKVQVKAGDRASFRVIGLDQYGDPCDVSEVQWEATGGTISAEGEFLAGSEAGQFRVTARTARLESTAEVHIWKTNGNGPDGDRTLSWSGQVPPQKWMNFYTRVLSKHATNPELKLTVSLEVPIPANEAESHVQQTRAALGELGLSDDVALS